MSDVRSSANPDSTAKSISFGWFVLPLLMVLLAIGLIQAPRGSRHSGAAIGKPAPQVELVRLTSESDFERVDEIDRGDITLIHFWGTWCGPCKMEYPELAEMATRMRDVSNFRFLSVSCEGDSSETLQGLAEKTFVYFETEGIESPAYADPNGTTRLSAAERLGQPSLYYPTSMLVGTEGKIVGVWEGYAPESVGEMEAMIQGLVSR